jgi:hypothetical protein
MIHGIIGSIANQAKEVTQATATGIDKLVNEFGRLKTLCSDPARYDVVERIPASRIRITMLVMHFEHRQLEILIKISPDNCGFWIVAQGDWKGKNHMSLKTAENMAVVKKKLFGCFNTQFIEIFNNDNQPLFTNLRQFALDFTYKIVAMTDKIR